MCPGAADTDAEPPPAFGVAIITAIIRLHDSHHDYYEWSSVTIITNITNII